MESHEGAAAALDALNTKYTWPGMQSPMVVKWMDTALQTRRREHHMAAARGNSGLALGLTAPGSIGLQALPGIQPGSYGLQIPASLGTHSPAGFNQAGAQLLRQAPDSALAQAGLHHQARLLTAGLRQQAGGVVSSRQHLQGRNQQGAQGRSIYTSPQKPWLAPLHAYL
jgi:hypothetical protein